MRHFIDEVRASLDAGIYSPALLGALAIPDACGAVDSPMLQNGARYKKWYNEWVGYTKTDALEFGGNTVWAIRNGMLHETTTNFKKYGFDRVVFTAPASGLVFYKSVSTLKCGTRVIGLDLKIFVDEITSAAERWLNEIEARPEMIERLDALIQFRPQGWSTYVVGAPVIT